MSRIDKIKDVMRSLRTETPDVEGVILTDLDGLTMASSLSEEMDEGEVAARTAAMLGIGERCVNDFKMGKLHQVYVKGEKGYILVVEAGEKAAITVLTTEKAKLGMIFHDANRAAIEIAAVLS